MTFYHLNYQRGQSLSRITSHYTDLYSYPNALHAIVCSVAPQCVLSTLKG